MSGMVFPLTSGIAHNSDPRRTSDGFIQRYAFSQTLSPEVVERFRGWSREQATRFIEQMDDWLAQNEDQVISTSANTSSAHQNAGIGVFYYEGRSAEDLLNEPQGGSN